MTVGVKVFVALPEARRLFTAALTLSSESPGGSSVDEDGSSSTRGFFDLGGWTSCVLAGREADAVLVSSENSFEWEAKIDDWFLSTAGLLTYNHVK